MRATISRAFAGTMLVCALAAPTLAQEPMQVREQAQDLAQAPDLRGSVADEAAPPLSAEQIAALGNALMFDPAALTAAAPSKPLRLPSLSDPRALDMSQSDKPDGSRALAIKKPLLADPTWDARVGADVGIRSRADDVYRQGKLPVVRDAGDSGAAWASVGVQNLATVDARVDPANDQGKLGTTIKHSIPLGKNYAVTLQNTYSVTETLSASTSAPGDLPLMATPAPSAAPATQVWGNEKLAKFDLLSTGTTLAAGLNSVSTDPVTHNKFSAEQKIYGPLRVTTAVSDLGQPVPTKSITAGFKLNW